MPTPARRTLKLDFAGPPDLDAIAQVAKTQTVAGAFVRIRWNVPEEDRHEVDLGAIEALLAGAAGVKLEGRIVPIQRRRAPGISGPASLPEKIQAWAEATDVPAAPLLEWLAAQETPNQAAAMLDGRVAG